MLIILKIISRMMSMQFKDIIYPTNIPKFLVKFKLLIEKNVRELIKVATQKPRAKR